MVSARMMFTFTNLIGLAFMVSSCTAQNAQIESCASPLVEGVCQDNCPTCVLGQGHTQFCGFGMGSGAECQICEPEVTYSQSQEIGSDYTYYTCADCTQCVKTFLRETAGQCDIYQDTRCGQCLPETFGVEPPSRPEMPTYPCYPCSESERDAEPQCEAYWKRVDKEAADDKFTSKLNLGLTIGIPVFVVMVIVLVAVIVGYHHRADLRRWYRMYTEKLGVAAQNEEKKSFEEGSEGPWTTGVNV